MLRAHRAGTIPLLLLVAATAKGVPATDGASPEHVHVFRTQVTPFVQTYCVGCHNEQRERGGLRLDTYPELARVARDHTTWATVLDKLLSHQMPPAKEKQPTPTERDAIVQWIQAELADDPCDGHFKPGRVTLRRLNRAEYDNTIRDLLGVDLHLGEDFPVDDSGYGFDNIGDVLTVSPLLMERYLTAAERVARAVIVVSEPEKPSIQRVSGDQLARGEKPGDSSDDGTHVLATSSEVGTDFDFPQAGAYWVRARAYGQQAGPEPTRMAFCLDGKDVGTVDVKAEENDPGVFTFKIQPERGKHRLSLKFLNDYYDPSNQDPKLRGDRNLVIESLELQAPLQYKPKPLTDAHRRVVTCTPAPTVASRQACARRIVGEVARRAFRRPVTPEETDRFAGLVTQIIQEGGSFEEGVQLALQAILVSPSFLFLVESGPEPERVQPDGTYRLSDYELAAQLSYFLWSSTPDEELFTLARNDQLHKDTMLVQQVARMLKDPRSSALADNFAGQWLGLRKLDEVTPDLKRFPQFNESLRQAMAEESRRFFQRVLRDDRSIMDFVLADYTFVNEQLARHYGMSDVQGPEFRLVKTTSIRPGGLLAQASVLTVTSNPTRTSPVKRGKWVLEQLLGTPPPPPPPEVPPLEEGKQVELKGTLRQRMEQHRSRADCSSCHARMDPIGFGLENYDAIGAWRERENTFPIDSSGTLPTGESFHGPAELQRIVLAKRDQFRRCLTGKLLTYALGRGIEYTDRCTVDDISAKLAAQGDRFSVLITEIAKSRPFRFRSMQEKAP